MVAIYFQINYFEVLGGQHKKRAQILYKLPVNAMPRIFYRYAGV